MTYELVCEALGVTPDGDLEAAFRQLFYLHPESGCESIQLVNLLLPLVMDLLRTHFNDIDTVNINLFFYSKVGHIIQSLFDSCFSVFQGFHGSQQSTSLAGVFS